MLENTAIQPNQYSSKDTTRVALLVEYCGKFYFGSQYQPGCPTVQQALQDALKAINLTTSAVSFAGRTDAGVNAIGQVAHVDVAADALQNIPNLASALNAVLPETVSVRDIHIGTGRQFNSRRDALSKWYRYRIYNGDTRSVWADRSGAVHIRKPLDAERMDKAARLLLGCHDFKSFKDSDTAVTDNVCRIQHAAVSRDGETITLDLVADRFLYKMVRNIVGQLILIGQADKPQAPERILDVLNARDRREAAATARPEGLSLMAVQYPAPFDFFRQDTYVRQLNSLLEPTMEPIDHENLLRKAS